MSDASISKPGQASWGIFRAAQLARLVATGITLWFVGALVLRWVAPLGAYDGLGRVALYGLLIPGTLPFVLALPWLAGIQRNQIAAGAAIATAAAMAMDGIALAWYPGLYGDTVAYHAGAGAAILWGAAVAVALGFLCNRD